MSIHKSWQNKTFYQYAALACLVTNEIWKLFWVSSNNIYRNKIVLYIHWCCNECMRRLKILIVHQEEKWNAIT